MASKAPKKKESREQVNSVSKEAAVASTSVNAEERLSSKKKPPIPLWPEWNDQDIANEKWDNGKIQKDRGRSPTATLSCFEDTDGKIELPSSLKARVHTWKRPCELFNDKVPVVVNQDFAYETCIDLLTPNEHITDSELIRHIISTFTSLYQIFGLPNEPEAVSSIIKIKPSISKDAKDANTKQEKTKKEIEYFDEMGWKPWYQIWPKEGTKSQNVPSYNPTGKYAVKIFWMGCYRKIIVDDTIPCDENLKPLLPLTMRGNEVWVLILTKALIKVASLDYYGGLPNSEMGDSNIIHCLTGWIPESIPIEAKNSDKIWDLLFNFLPHWTLPQPIKKIDDCTAERRKSQIAEEVVTSKQELLPKESKDKGKKDEKGKDDKRVKTSEKIDRENKNKEKPATPICTKKVEIPTPDYVLFATFLNPPSGQYNISDLKEMANISQKLRQFGLCQYLSHPIYLNSIRICPLFPPPEPLQIPKWKLIRQKKNREVVEPKCFHQKEEKEPKCLELKSALFNFSVNTASTTVIASPTKPEKLKPAIQIPSISEEGLVEDNTRRYNDKNVTMETTASIESNAPIGESEAKKKATRSLSTSSQGSQGLNPKNAKVTKSKQDARKSAQKDKGNIDKSQSRNIAVAIDPPADDVEVTDSGDINSVTITDTLNDNVEKDDENEIVLWMDFDDFLQCFSTLWIYHKPRTHLKGIADIKGFEQKSDKPRKSAGANTHPGHSLTSPSSGIFGGIHSEASPPFLLIDSINEAEVAIVFSSFSRWFDPNLDHARREENSEALQKALTPITGTLIVEPYFWKSIVTASPLLRMSTTAIKAAVITLPPGRHVLRFMINTPLGYHVCISSSQPFLFDEEHMVMQHLTKDSARFLTHGIDVLKQLKLISQSFGDKSIPRSCKFDIGTENQPGDVRVEHFKALYNSLAVVLKSDLEDNFHPAMKFALNALKYESYFHTKKITTERKSNRSKSANDIKSRATPSISDSRTSLPTIILTSSNPDNEEEAAATKMKATFKGFYVRKLMKAYAPGSLENNVVTEMFTKIWSHIDANIEEFATKLYHKLFEENPKLTPLFPFHTDEWNKVAYCDYNGSYPEPLNSSWFLIFREIFYVMESNLILPKFYCNIPNCHLKVINNDTAEELETSFSKIVPQVMDKNKHGYTFVATASNQSNYVPGGKFRLRVIGERDSLPLPVKEATVSTHFVVKEIRDYYIPNRYNRIFRHSVKAIEDVLCSIQFYTSKEDVYVKLQVLENDQVIYSCEGKNCLVIPALIFYKDRFPSIPEDSSRRSSQTASIGSLPKGTNNKQTRRTSSPEKNKRKSIQLNDISSINEEEILEEQIHKYVVEGFVLRDSWPLTRKEWTFVKNQKNIELDKEGSSDSVVKVETVTRANSGKSRKSNVGKDSRTSRTRPPSQTQTLFDDTKANWVLRFVVDANLEGAVEIKRDTQRDEEIKAIKSAWETVEPGRATKAQLSRQKYLDSHTIPDNDVETKEEENADEDEVVKETDLEEAAIYIINEAATTDSPQPSEPDTGELFLEAPMKENLPVLITFDTTPYIRSTGKTVILNEYEEEKRQSTLQDKFANFQQTREMLLQMRENNRIARNLEKGRQLAEYEKMQIKLDEARSELYKSREVYRNKFIPQPELISEPEVEKKKRTPSPKAKSSKTKTKKK